MAVVLITGCSSGIGLEATKAFARNGDTVVATMRNLDKADGLRHALASDGSSADIEQLDVRDDESVSKAVSATLDNHGRIDVLVNNAGVGPMAAFERMSDNEMQTVWDTNLFGPMRLCKAVVPTMREQGDGTILNVSSVAGRVPSPVATMYSASKAALSAFSVGLAAELHPHGIRVAAIEPGFYATPILEKVISSLSEKDNPYADAERRVKLVFEQAATEAEDPADVAHALVATVEAESLESIRIIVGESGEQFARGRENLSDADFLALNAAQSDEEYFALFAEAFPPLN